METEALADVRDYTVSAKPVQENLRWGCDEQLADRVCNYNRHAAEHSGYFMQTALIHEINHKRIKEVKFYDSNSGKPVFVAPKGRTMQEFLLESRAHGWLSFRDEEVQWENVRVLQDGEAVSIDGTHLGHNLPAYGQNRYSINIVAISGRPSA